MDIKKFVYKNILRRQYYRYGSCNRCGDCCSKIYVRHKKGIIKTEEEFLKLKKQHPFYASLEIVEINENGVLFKCKKFDREKRVCTIHKFRSAICRKYPSEDIFKFGAVMSEQCGYYFKPIDKFSEILEKEMKKSKYFGSIR
jgi:Fe-S-cluster containining protein